MDEEKSEQAGKLSKTTIALQDNIAEANTVESTKNTNPYVSDFRVLKNPLQNVTNIKKKQKSLEKNCKYVENAPSRDSGEKTNNSKTVVSKCLTDDEMRVQAIHLRVEKKDVTAMLVYRDSITRYYESIDRAGESMANSIDFSQRSAMVDWIISAHLKLGLVSDTLLLSIYFIDLFLSKKAPPVSKLHLLGLSCLWIAAKIEEVECPDIGSFLSLEPSISVMELKKAEKFVLHSVDYRCDFVNPLFFLRNVSRANNFEFKSRTMGKYFVELMILNEEFRKYTNKTIGITAIYLSRKICKTDENINLFFKYSGIERREMKGCFEDLVSLIYKKPVYENLERKYSHEKYQKLNEYARTYAQENFS